MESIQSRMLKETTVKDLQLARPIMITIVEMTTKHRLQARQIMTPTMTKARMTEATMKEVTKSMTMDLTAKTLTLM